MTQAQEMVPTLMNLAKIISDRYAPRPISQVILDFKVDN